MPEVIRKGQGSAVCDHPLLFVHGAWHGAWCWDEFFLDHFAGLGYDCVAMNLRGHGGSPGVEKMNRYRIADYVADVAEVAATLEAEPIVIAHSMGGLVTQHFLARYPARAGVLLGSVPPFGVWKVVLNMLRQHPLRFLAANLSWNLHLLVDTPAKSRELFYSQAVADSDVERWTVPLTSESYLAFLDMLLLDLPKRGAVQCPLRVLGAEIDTIFPPADVQATADFYGTHPRIFPGMAHNMMLEPGWQQVADDIHDWIQGGFIDG